MILGVDARTPASYAPAAAPSTARSWLQPTRPETGGQASYTPAPSPVTPGGTPHAALRARDRTDPSPPPPKRVAMPSESFGEARTLTAYEYAMSKPELQRVREHNPTAAGTISTELTAAPLTWEAYDALTPAQRSVVDFNTLLVEAREKDLMYPGITGTANVDPDQYGEDVLAMFGEGGGSETPAYNVVNLLKSIDFSAVGQDLDDFLSLDRAVTADELEHFAFSKDEVVSLDEFTTDSVNGIPTQGRANMGDLPPGFVPPGMPQPTGEQGYNPMALVPGANIPAPDPAAEAIKSRLRGEGKAVPPAGKPIQPAPAPPPLNLEAMKLYANVRSPENIAALTTALARSTFNAYKGMREAETPGFWSLESALSGQNEFGRFETPLGAGRAAEGDTDLQLFEQSLDDAYLYLLANPNDAGLAQVYKDFEDRPKVWRGNRKQRLWSYLNTRAADDAQYLLDKNAVNLRNFLGWNGE